MFWTVPLHIDSQILIPYWHNSGLGAVSSTASHQTIYDTTRPTVYSNFFNQANQDVLQSFESFDPWLWKRERIAEAALEQVTGADTSQQARTAWEDTQERMDRERGGPRQFMDAGTFLVSSPETWKM